jgi:hypothetical protein
MVHIEAALKPKESDEGPQGFDVDPIMFSIDILCQGEGIVQKDSIHNRIDVIFGKVFTSFTDLFPNGVKERIDSSDLLFRTH